MEPIEIEQLTNEQMEEAIFAHFCQGNVNYSNGREAALDVERGCDAEGNDEPMEAWAGRVRESVEQYFRGKAVLAMHKLKFSERTAVPYGSNGERMVKIPGNTSGVLLVEFGHIATSPAYRFAYFIPRQD